MGLIPSHGPDLCYQFEIKKEQFEIRGKRGFQDDPAVADQTSDVTLKRLLNPTENHPKAVKAVLEFIAAVGLIS